MGAVSMQWQGGFAFGDGWLVPRRERGQPLSRSCGGAVRCWNGSRDRRHRPDRSAPVRPTSHHLAEVRCGHKFKLVEFPSTKQRFKTFGRSVGLSRFFGKRLGNGAKLEGRGALCDKGLDAVSMS